MTFRLRFTSGLVVAFQVAVPGQIVAQTQPIPAVGEPPSPQQRAAEEAALTTRARESWLQNNEGSMRQMALREVMGPSAFTKQYPVYQPPTPRLSLHVVKNLAYGLSYQYQTVQTGISTYLDLRLNPNWGVMTGPNYLMWRSRRVNLPDPTAPPEFIHTRAPGFHVAAYRNFSRAASTLDMQRFHVMLGCQFQFPLDKRYDPALPSWFISPTLHILGVIAAAPIGRHGFVAISANAGVSYHIPIGDGNDGGGEGFFWDGMYGLLMGF